MANTIIQLKYSTVTGNSPSSLANGEIAINNQDGKLFYSTPSGTIQYIQGFTGPSGLNKEVQFNDNGVLGANASLTFDKTTGNLTATRFTGSLYIDSNAYFVVSTGNPFLALDSNDYFSYDRATNILRFFIGGTEELQVNSSGLVLANPLAVGSGGTGLSTITANSVLLGNGTGNMISVAPGTAGNVLTSENDTWVSKAASSTGGGITIGKAYAMAILFG